MNCEGGTHLVLLLLEVLLQSTAVGVDLALGLILGALHLGATGYKHKISVRRVNFFVINRTGKDKTSWTCRKGKKNISTTSEAYCYERPQ